MKHYYVYIHRQNETNIVFYLGRGSNDRARRDDKRSEVWKKYAKLGYSIEFLAENLTKQEAIRIENNYLLNPDISWELCNKKKNPEIVKDLNNILHIIEEWVFYDESSPSCLRWRKDTKGRSKKGNIAGSKTKNGYFEITLQGIRYYVHRLIYVLHNKNIDINKTIDHKDGNNSNNKIDNLQEIDQRQNAQNRKNNRKTKTGFPGVYFNKNKAGNEYYIAGYCDLATKYRYKIFSVKKLGEKIALEQAINFRKQKIEELNANGQQYTDRHLQN